MAGITDPAFPEKISSRTYCSPGSWLENMCSRARFSCRTSVLWRDVRPPKEYAMLIRIFRNGGRVKSWLLPLGGGVAWRETGRRRGRTQVRVATCETSPDERKQMRRCLAPYITPNPIGSRPYSKSRGHSPLTGGAGGFFARPERRPRDVLERLRAGVERPGTMLCRRGEPTWLRKFF